MCIVSEAILEEYHTFCCYWDILHILTSSYLPLGESTFITAGLHFGKPESWVMNRDCLHDVLGK
jgi:hypothetical protein